MIDVTMRYLIPSLVVGVMGFIVYWVKRVEHQELENRINEIDLTLQKIQFKNSTNPIDQLISDSNKQHGSLPNTVGQEPGNNDKKE